MRAPDAEKFQHRALGIQDSAAAESADFQRRHGDGDLERATETGQIVSMLLGREKGKTSYIGHLLLHNGDTVGALHNLGGVLTSGEEYGSDDVGGVGVETTH